jgi:predicted amidohydrolase
MTVRVATLAYHIERLPQLSAFFDKQARLVAEAAAQGAELLVFPEYASLELSATLPDEARADLASELRAMTPLWPEVQSCYRQLAQRHGVIIVSPSIPEEVPGGYVNRAHIFAPNHEAHQDKLQMTRFEREEWGICSGNAQHVFATSFGMIAVAICYDSEFPLLVRRLVEQGARLIVVPSCTDTLAGYYRVSLSCRARALENQCFLVQSSTVGSAPWSLTLDQNHGAGGVYGPVDRGYASDGVVAQGPLDVPGWVYADLDLSALNKVRREGQNKNHEDWNTPQHLTGEVTRMILDP